MIVSSFRRRSLGRVAALAGIVALSVGTVPTSAVARTSPDRTVKSASGDLTLRLERRGITNGMASYHATWSNIEGASGVVDFSSAIVGASGLRVYDDARVALAGATVTPSVSGIQAVDLKTGRLLIALNAFHPTFSPDGERVAYVAAHPQRMSPHDFLTSDVYRVVDLASDALPLRPRTLPLPSPEKIGRIDNTHVHDLVGPIHWVDDAHVGFTDRFRGQDFHLRYQASEGDVPTLIGYTTTPAPAASTDAAPADAAPASAAPRPAN